MNSRERVLTTLAHGQPDRIPLDLGSTLVTGIMRNSYLRLAEHLGQKVTSLELYDSIQQLAVMEESILETLQVDTRGLIPNFGRKNPVLQEQNGVYHFTDEWSMVWEKPRDSLYFNLMESPLAGDITEKDIEDFPWPRGDDPALFEGLEKKAQRYYQNGYAVILESLCSGIFEMSCRMRGLEQFYMDLSLNPELAVKLLDKFVELKIQYYQAAAEKLGDYIQCVKEADDVAGQETLLMSPRMYRDLFKPRHKQLFDAQRKFFPPPFYIFLHSDGAIFDIIPDFIEIGVQILNPVQLTAQGMEAERIKSEYGKDLCFWGGGVNTQEILPTGTPQEVRQNVKDRIAALAPGGGYVFATVHNIQDDVPKENVIALFEAFKEMRNY